MYNHHITRIAANNQISCIAIGYDSGRIKLFGSIRDDNEMNHVFSNQTSSIIYMVFDPLNEFLYASSKDKSYAIYSIKLLKSIKLFQNIYDIDNSCFLNYLNIVNICPHKYGLITCYLTNNAVQFYERHTNKLKYNVQIYTKSNMEYKMCLTRVAFLKDGFFFITSTSDHKFYVYDFIRMKLVYRFELYSYLPIRSYTVLEESIIQFINDRNETIIRLDLNKLI